MNDFLLQNWAELTLAFSRIPEGGGKSLRLQKNHAKYFGYIDTLVNMIIADRIKPNNKK